MGIHDIHGLYDIWCNKLMVFALYKSSCLCLLLKVLKDGSRFDFKIVLRFLSRCNLAQYIKSKGYWYIAFINRMDWIEKRPSFHVILWKWTYVAFDTRKWFISFQMVLCCYCAYNPYTWCTWTYSSIRSICLRPIHHKGMTIYKYRLSYCKIISTRLSFDARYF